MDSLDELASTLMLSSPVSWHRIDGLVYERRRSIRL